MLPKVGRCTVTLLLHSTTANTLAKAPPGHTEGPRSFRTGKVDPRHPGEGDRTTALGLDPSQFYLCLSRSNFERLTHHFKLIWIVRSFNKLKYKLQPE